MSTAEFETMPGSRFEPTYHQDIELREWVLYVKYLLVDRQRTDVDVQRELSSQSVLVIGPHSYLPESGE